MATISKALRIQLAREYEEGSADQEMNAAATIAPRASAADQVRLGMMQMLLPELVQAVEQVIVHASNKPYARAVAGGLLTYVCNPLDIIGDDQPLGRVDDALICAVGLSRLQKREHVQLTPRIQAICQMANESMAYLDDDLQESIREFLSELEASTQAGGKG
jgi:uncharacterized membrane protein YkvA (DUF1232 family)